MPTFTTLASALGAAALTAAVAVAQQPRLTNGKVTAQPAPALQQAFRAAVNTHADIGWIGYSVPVVDGERTMCCFNSGSGGNQACCGMCSLEPSLDGTMMSSRPQQSQPGGPVKLEGAMKPLGEWPEQTWIRQVLDRAPEPAKLATQLLRTRPAFHGWPIPIQQQFQFDLKGSPVAAG